MTHVTLFSRPTAAPARLDARHVAQRVAARGGPVSLALAIAGLGAVALATGESVPGLEPLPAALAAPHTIAYATGAFLAVAGMGLATRTTRRAAAWALALLLALWLTALHAPALAAAPRNGGAWTTAFETLALLGAALACADAEGARARRAGRTLYALSLPAFGALHFLYADYVASVIPHWIPGPYFWAYATGVAHVAGGIGLLLPRWRRLAAALVALMFGSWVAIVHAPRVAAAVGNRLEWTSLWIALAMCGGAWVLARDGDDEPVGRVVRALG